MVPMPQFTLSPRLWICVTDVVVITESLTRDLGKLRQERNPEAAPVAMQSTVRVVPPRLGLTSPPLASPFQPRPLEPGPLLYSRPAAGNPTPRSSCPAPTCPAYFPRATAGQYTRAPAALNPTRDASLSAPSRPHQALGARPPLQSPPRRPRFPLSLVAPRALPSPFSSADSPLFPCGPTLSRNVFSALFWDVSPWGGGAGLGWLGKARDEARAELRSRDRRGRRLLQTRPQGTVPRTGS